MRFILVFERIFSLCLWRQKVWCVSHIWVYVYQMQLLLLKKKHSKTKDQSFNQVCLSGIFCNLILHCSVVVFSWCFAFSHTSLTSWNTYCWSIISLQYFNPLQTKNNTYFKRNIVFLEGFFCTITMVLQCMVNVYVKCVYYDFTWGNLTRSWHECRHFSDRNLHN